MEASVVTHSIGNSCGADRLEDQPAKYRQLDIAEEPKRRGIPVMIPQLQKS
jgi:hypothetical protein